MILMIKIQNFCFEKSLRELYTEYIELLSESRIFYFIYRYTSQMKIVLRWCEFALTPNQYL